VEIKKTENDENIEQEHEETKEKRKKGYVKKVNKKNVWFMESNKR
jgi:hypothetical protein